MTDRTFGSSDKVFLVEHLDDPDRPTVRELEAGQDLNPPTPDLPPTLPDFLLARIAEDEELLTWGSGKPLRIHVDPGGDGSASFPFADRWRGECEAKRQIVEDMRRVFEDDCEYSGWVGFALLPLKRMAAVYSDHPDYREEWKP